MKTNQLKIGVILSYISMISQNLISIVYTPIMLRLLGQSEYGLYQLVASVVSYLGLLSFGFGSSYVRFYSRYKAKNDNVGIAHLNGLFLIVFVIIGFIALICGSVMTLNIELFLNKSLTIHEINTARKLMTLMTINLAISFPSSVFDSYLTAQEHFIFQRIVSILQIILNPFLTLPLLFLGYKSFGVVLVSTILAFLKIIVNIRYCLKKLNMRFLFSNFDFSLFKEIGVFSFFIFINMIIDQVNWNLDKFILGMFRGTAVVAVYSIAAQINGIYMSLSNSIYAVFVTRVNRLVAKQELNSEVSILFTKVGRIQFFLLSLILIGFILFGKFFISVWAGSGYENSYYVALILMLPITIPLCQNLGIEIQRAKNMHQFRSLIYLLIAFGNIFVSIPLCKMYGEIGAALGTGISLIVGNVIIMNLYYHYKIKLDMIYFWKNIISILPSIFLSFVFSNIATLIIPVDSIISFVINGISCVIIYCLVVYNLGMNEYEKSLVKNAFSKIKGNGVKK